MSQDSLMIFLGVRRAFKCDIIQYKRRNDKELLEKEIVFHFVNDLGVGEIGKAWALHVDDCSVHSLFIYTHNFSWTIYFCTALIYFTT